MRPVGIDVSGHQGSGSRGNLVERREREVEGGGRGEGGELAGGDP